MWIACASSLVSKTLVLTERTVVFTVGVGNKFLVEKQNRDHG
jgi:hypothetical protein